MTTNERIQRALPWVIGVLTFVPFLWCRDSFADLYWFGDEWDHLDSIDRVGLWTWTWTFFGENFVPLFKLLFGGLIYVSGGSYFVTLVALWGTHAIATGLFGWFLRLHGFGTVSVAISAVVFGLSSTNLETLAWTTQWMTILNAAFMLGAFIWCRRFDVVSEPWSWWKHGVLVLLVTGSALSMVRGVLTGAVLAAVFLLQGGDRPAPIRKRIAVAALAILPSVVVTLIILTRAHGNHEHLSGHGAAILSWIVWYFALNPIHGLLEIDTLGWRTVAILGLAKVALMIWGLRATGGSQRRALALLVWLTLGESVLVGVGRYHIGFPSVVGTRYQYLALISLVPFAALLVEKSIERLTSRERARAVAAALFVLTAAGWVARRWPADMQSWAGWRGRDTRKLIAGRPDAPEIGAVPGIPFLRTDRARELAKKFNLH